MIHAPTGREPGPFRIAAAADPTYGSVLRAFSTAVGREAGVDEERVDDLRLLLTEIHASAEPTGTPLTVEVATSAGGLTVRCEGAGPPPDRAGEAGGFRARLLDALAPDMRWTDDGVVDFTIPR